MLFGPKTLDQFFEGCPLLNGVNIGTRHHHIADAQFAKFEQVREHSAFLWRKIGTLAVALFDDLFKAFTHGMGMAAAQKMREALQKGGVPAVSGRGFVFVVMI